MSWNNTTPWWVLDLQYERFLAECSCCFVNEYNPRDSEAFPKNYIVKEWL